MLRDFILISILICAACSLFRPEKCYHQKCEINQGYYTECDQEKYKCTRWNETLYGSTGRCRYWGSPSINSYINCDIIETCTSDPVTGQAVCGPNRKHFSDIPTVHPTEHGTENGTDDIFHDVTKNVKSLMSSTVEFVLIGIGAVILVVVLVCVAVCRSTGEGCFKNRQRRVQRLDSLQSPLVENVEVEPITNPTELAVHPVTQYPTASHPSVQIEYASQNPSHFPPPYTAAQYPATQYPAAQHPAAQYPGAQYPAAQYPGAQYPGAQYPAAQYPAAQYPGSNIENPSGYSSAQYPQSAQILQTGIQEPPVVTSPARTTSAEVTKNKSKKTPAKKTSTQTTPKIDPSTSDAHHGGYAPPPTGTLTPGAVVRLTSKAHGKNLRIHQNGQIDGRGGTGQWATFMVHARGPYIALSLQDHPNKFLAIKNNSLTHGTGGKFCSLIVKPHPDGTVSLESAEHRTQHVGILPNGDPKGPHHTGTGDHGKFYVN